MFCIRRLLSQSRCLRQCGGHVNSARCMASISDRLLLDKDDKTGIVTMKLNRPPMNFLDLDLLADIAVTMETLENDKSARGLILTSTNQRVFSAGVDIMELYQPQGDRLREFWQTLQRAWLALYSTRLATVAAINGHSPAGGCLLALCFDYRMMAPGFTIGINETQLGVIPPFWFEGMFHQVCGARQSELCCQKGLMLTTDQAHAIGLVDDVVDNEVMQEKAEKEMKSWLKVPDFARQLTKAQIRKPVIDNFLARREEDTNYFVNFLTQDSVQEKIGTFLATLKEKKKK